MQKVMKLDIERIILWSIITILIFMVIQQRRSGFMISNGSDSNIISIYDLFEFKNSVDPAKLAAYKLTAPPMMNTFSNVWNNISNANIIKMSVPTSMIPVLANKM